MAIDVKELSLTQTYSTQAPPEDILADMEELRQRDGRAEGKASTWGGVALACWIFAVVFGLIGFAAPPLFGVALLLVIVGAFASAKKNAHKRLDLVNRRYELVNSLVRLLEADLAPDGALTVQADLGPPDNTNKLARNGQVDAWSVEYYRDPWLSMRGRFLDGTSFAISFTHDLQKRSKRKVNPRGKVKHKSKRKAKNTVAVQLRPKPKKYPHLPRLAQDLDKAVQLPSHTDLALAHIDGHRATIKAQVDDGWREDGAKGSQVVAMMLLSLYQVLNLAKAIEKRERAA